MRNVFDQYTQPENRLTHALVCTLDSDRSLLRPFLRWAGATDVPPASQLQLTEQQVPGEPVSGEEVETRGVPDACVFDDHGWAMLVEAKVQAAVSKGQLRRHISTAQHHGFERPFLLLLSVDDPPRMLPERATHRAWREVYLWFRLRRDSSRWSCRFTEYMETFESRMIAENYSIRGTLTMFDGLRFDDKNPYTYREGKRLIRLLGDELQKRTDFRAIGIDPEGKRRPAITKDEGTLVWDFLPLEVGRGAQNFTDFPHLTLALKQEEALAAITVPNGVKGGFRRKLQRVGEQGFREILMKIEEQLRPLMVRSRASNVMLYASQRHYRSQRSRATVDARLDMDLRTMLPGERREAKYQPEWLHAIYEVVSGKRSNIQLALECHLSYSCEIVRSPEAVNLFAESWIAMSPLLRLVLDE